MTYARTGSTTRKAKTLGRLTVDALAGVGVGLGLMFLLMIVLARFGNFWLAKLVERLIA